MILGTIREIDIYSNGQLAYESTYGIIAQGWENAYPHALTNLDGRKVVRIGMTRKFWSSGHIHWELYYSEGQLARSCVMYRADGTPIEDGRVRIHAPTDFQAQMMSIDKWRVQKDTVIKEIYAYPYKGGNVSKRP